MLEGAYRLLNNPVVQFDDICEGSAEGTSERAAAAGSVLVVHDTTTCEFADADPEQVGFLSTGNAGFFFHASLVLDANGLRRPLGVVAAEVIAREQRSGRGSRKRRATTKEMSQWKDKESERWIRGVREAANRLESCRDVIHVMDREGDSFGLLSAMKQENQRFVVRSCHERTAKDVDEQDWSSLYATLQEHQGEFEREVQLSRRVNTLAKGMKRSGHPPRMARSATLRFAATSVQIKRPRCAPESSEHSLQLSLVRIWENEPPSGETPVEWWLLSTEPVDTVEQIARVVDIYRQRWVVEEFFKALKTGCLYEQRQFESRHALLNLLASSLPVAVEMLHLRTCATSTPQAPATDVISEIQIEVLRRVSPRRLSDSPTCHEVLLAIAGLGGHWRSNGPPGWLILKRGMVKLLAFEVGWRAALEAKKCDR
jgi:IS4 transposase